MMLHRVLLTDIDEVSTAARAFGEAIRSGSIPAAAGNLGIMVRQALIPILWIVFVFAILRNLTGRLRASVASANKTH
jgi:hypothetical protein